MPHPDEMRGLLMAAQAAAEQAALGPVAVPVNPGAPPGASIGLAAANGAALSNGAAAAAGTLLNAPAAGNPTKWIPINDNGTTRYIPAW